MNTATWSVNSSSMLHALEACLSIVIDLKGKGQIYFLHHHQIGYQTNMQLMECGGLVTNFDPFHSSKDRSIYQEAEFS